MNDRLLSEITGLSRQAVKGYENLYPLILIHSVAEDSLASTDGKLKKAVVDIPNIGKLIYNTKRGTYSFKPTKLFESYMKMAVEKGYSPLNMEVSKRMVEKINREYKSLL